MPLLEEEIEPFLERAYGISVLTTRHRLARRLLRNVEPEAHGHKTWGSSYLLMDYLLTHPLRQRGRVLEVGCGWAPAGVFCAKQFQARVLGVDIDPKVFPFAEAMCTLNGVTIKTKEGQFNTMKKADFSGVDLVLGSDICFWNELVTPLEKMIRRALAGGVKRVLIADPGRPTFFRMAKRFTKQGRGELLEWYALEPRRFEGNILVVS